jgi:hypothetical protein
MKELEAIQLKVVDFLANNDHLGAIRYVQQEAHIDSYMAYKFVKQIQKELTPEKPEQKGD